MGMRKRREGFTLIELLAVVFILAVGLISVSALFVAGIISSRKAERLGAATNAVQQQLERLRSTGFSGCVVDTEIFKSEDGYTILQQNSDGTGRIGFMIPDLPEGQGEIEFAFYDTGAGVLPNLKEVTITATWAGGATTGGTTTVQTLIANRP
jgi:prepilin-type N-terminal cleavage/methylation domain-containing protein